MISFKQKYVCNYLAVILFVAIAAHHFYQVYTAQLSPWLGGGFGMFSTTDYGPSRYIKIYGLTDNIIQEQIEIPGRYLEIARKLRSLPSHKNIQTLAVVIEKYLKATQHSFPHLRVEVWGIRYNNKTLVPTSYLLNVINYRVDL